MTKYLSIMGLMLAVMGLVASPSLACSTFCLLHSDQPFFGRNYDWSIDNGLVMINKRQVAKRAAGRDGNLAQWVSKYGSVTFNQYGRELPSEGVNEAGLVVAVLWLSATEHAAPDARPTIKPLICCNGYSTNWIRQARSMTCSPVMRTCGFVRRVAPKSIISFVIKRAPASVLSF